MSAVTSFSAALPPLASAKPSAASRALGALRSQAAFLRTLLDEVERLAPASGSEHGLSEQVIEELARLGCLSLEAASQLTHVVGDHGTGEGAALATSCRTCAPTGRHDEACPRLALVSDTAATSTVRLVLGGGAWRDKLEV